MSQRTKAESLGALTLALFFAALWLMKGSVIPCPTAPPRVTTRVVTHTIYAPVPTPTPGPVVVVVTPGRHHTLCLTVVGKTIDPVGLQDCWGAPDKTERVHGHIADPY